jgi:hypothetical protein
MGCESSKWLCGCELLYLYNSLNFNTCQTSDSAYFRIFAVRHSCLGLLHFTIWHVLYWSLSRKLRSCLSQIFWKFYCLIIDFSEPELTGPQLAINPPSFMQPNLFTVSDWVLSEACWMQYLPSHTVYFTLILSSPCPQVAKVVSSPNGFVTKILYVVSSLPCMLHGPSIS